MREHCDAIVERSRMGFPTYVIVWGPTRSGKTTLSMQCCKYIANQLNVPFDSENEIWFGAEDLLEQAKGKNKGVYLLDEGAFDLMSTEWQKKEQQNMVKYMMTAAKYAQVIFIAIPKLEKLQYDIVSDDHTRGVEIYLSKDLKRREFRIYPQDITHMKWYFKKKKRFKDAKKLKGLRGTFSSKTQFIDMDLYENKKDKAISSIGQDENKVNKKEIELLKVLSWLRDDTNYTYKDVGKALGKRGHALGEYLRNNQYKLEEMSG